MATSNEYQNQILARAAEDDDFRNQLMDNASAAIASELNVEVPSELTINVHEDGRNVVNLVLPPKVELDQSQMDSIAGGTDDTIMDPDEQLWS